MSRDAYHYDDYDEGSRSFVAPRGRTMGDIRGQVARAMAEVYNQPGCDVPKDVLDSWIPYADAALAVAEPAIRAQVVEELAQKAEQEHPDCLTPCDLNPVGDDWQLSLADWLRAQNT
jgi:hypothetical protein